MPEALGFGTSGGRKKKTALPVAWFVIMLTLTYGSTSVIVSTNGKKYVVPVGPRLHFPFELQI